MIKPVKNYKLKIFLTSLISCLVTFAVCIALVAGAVFHTELGNTVYKFLTIHAIVKDNYIGEYEFEDAETKMMSGYLSSLGDKYAKYYDLDEAEVKHDSEQGMFFGIGVTVAKHPDNGNMFVVHVYNSSEASKAGLQSGDVITKVGDLSVADNYQKAFSAMKGKSDEKIRIVYQRDGKDYETLVGFSDCEIQSVFYKKIGNIGYIDINSFNSATVDQFKDAVDNLISADVKGLIFDLRSNGGGTVSSVCSMLDYICPEGDLISVEYNDKSRLVLRKSDEETKVELPMAVLTNSSTASASELFAANIRDFEMGCLVGDTTYGKGVMQNTYTLHDGSALKITVARFFPHGGVCFDSKGLVPDVKVKLTDEEQKYINIYTTEQDPVVKAALNWFANKK